MKLDATQKKALKEHVIHMLKARTDIPRDSDSLVEALCQLMNFSPCRPSGSCSCSGVLDENQKETLLQLLAPSSKGTMQLSDGAVLTILELGRHRKCHPPKFLWDDLTDEGVCRAYSDFPP